MTCFHTEEFDSFIARAIEAHKSGDFINAETCWMEALKINPDHIGARHNLGVLLACKKDYHAAIETFNMVIRAKPDHAQAHANRAGVLRAMGNMRSAVAAYQTAIEIAPNFFQAYLAKGDTLFSWKRYKEAIEVYSTLLLQNAKLYLARKGRALAFLAIGDEDAAFEDFKRICSFRVFSDQPNKITHLKLRHDLEQFLYLSEGEQYAKILSKFDSEIDWPQDENEPVRISKTWAKSFKAFFNKPIKIAVAKKVKNPLTEKAIFTLNSFEEKKNEPQVIDGLLNKEALESLRRYLLESTIWNDFTHIDGFVATYLETGLASPLFLQIVTALRQTSAFRDLPLVQGWAFKGVSSKASIGMHSDDAKLSLNLWITPNNANLEPEHGGLIVHRHLPPADWSLSSYHQDKTTIEEWLGKNNTNPLKIAYRENRAVLFDSRLFHGSGLINFAEGYENKRINITLLFGN